MAGSFFFTTKQATRQAVETIRRSLSSHQVSDWGDEVQRHLVALSCWKTAKLVALYEAQPFEVPTSALRRCAGRACLPRVVKGSRVLAFHEVEPTSTLIRGPMGLLQPSQQTSLVALADIDVWVVPGVAFTRAGDRLGRGAGYYDATLAQARPTAVTVGVAFECCVVDQLPTEGHDVRVDWLVTERGAAQCRRER